MTESHSVSVRRGSSPETLLSAWMRAVTDTVQAINAEQHLPHILNRIAWHACELFGLDQCAVYVLDTDGKTFRLEGSRGLTRSYVAWANSDPLRLDSGTARSGAPTVRAVLTGRPVFTRDIFKEPGLDSWHSVMAREGFHSIVAAPLLAADNVPIGTITGYSIAERDFHPDQIRMLSLLSDHAAAAIIAARHRDQEQAAIAQLSSANEALRSHELIVQHLRELQQELTRMLLQGVELAGIAEFLAAELDATIVIDTDDGVELAAAPADSPLRVQVTAASSDLSGQTAQILESGRARDLDGTGPAAICLAPAAGPAPSRTRLWAARTSPDRFDDDEHWAMEGCALLIALERSRSERHAEAEARLAKDLLADLVSPAAMVHAESVMARARALGHDPRHPHTLALFVPVPGRAVPGRAQTTTRLAAALLNATSGMRPRPVVGSVGDSVAVLLPEAAGSDGTEPAVLIRLLHSSRDVTDGSVRCVIGPRLPSLIDVQSTMALVSRAAGLVTPASPQIMNMADFGVYGLLLESGSGEGLTEFADKILGPVQSIDRRRSSELMNTLRAWLRCNMSNQSAAGQLHVHPNTVGYRMKQVAKATGLDLASPSDLVTLQLAAMVFDINGRTLDAPISEDRRRADVL